MHRKLTLFNLIVIAVMLGGLLLAGCKSATPEPTEAPTTVPQPTEAPEPTAVPEPTEAPEPTAEPEPTEEPVAEATILDAAGAYSGAGFKLMTAEALFENLNDGDDSNDPLIIDIRAAEDYGTGHVPGAVNVGAGALFTPDVLAALPSDGQIVVYCYSGQTAGQATAALNMLGYDAYSLKFGYPGWTTENVSKGLWNDDMSMGYEADTEAHQASGSYDLPEPLAEDVAAAAEAYFGDGMRLITAEALFENLSDGDDSNDPFIVDLRKPEDYEAGHVPGAVNVGGGALFTPDVLATVPTDVAVVVYCYTGQTAGQATAMLNMLGYDAYSLKFGMPSWAITTGPRWNNDMSMNYAVETESHELSGGASAGGNGVLDAAGAYFGEGMKLITAETIYENLNDGDDSNDPLIIDIRKPEDYEAGHVTGAVNLGAGALFSAETLAALPTDQQIVVYCYTGQTAGQAVAALNMLGYDAYSLKFGMPSWAITTGPRWNDDMSMSYPLDSESYEATETHALPAPLATDVAGAAEAYFSDGTDLTTAEAVYENLNDGDDSNDPFIVSICKPDDYQAGHVPGAVDIGAGALFTADELALLPPDQQIVVYCYTGQTAGQVTAALNMLGYDAYSLKFGSASWAIREGAPRWNDDMSMNYPVDTEAHELP